MATVLRRHEIPEVGGEGEEDSRLVEVVGGSDEVVEAAGGED